MIEANTITRTIWDEELDLPRPDMSNVITEDDTPVDNQFSEKQMRLLTESIHSSWRPGFPFVAMANVGVYVALNRPAIVPDVFITTHVEPLQDLMDKEHKAYLSWLFEGKVPDVVIEIVSNTKGGELTTKLRNYEHMRVSWYVVFDPGHYLSEQTLTLFSLDNSKYVKRDGLQFDNIPLGILVWEGEFEGVTSNWLRWTGPDGTMLLTGHENSQRESQRAAAESQRAAAFAAKLRELGLDPETLL
jgi:Uma2 family endonuclease